LLTESPATDQADLIAHLDHCVACRQELDRLAGARPTLLDAASALSSKVHVAEPTLRRVLNDLENDANLLTLYYHPDNDKVWGPAPAWPAGSLDRLTQFDGYEVTTVLGQGGMGLVLKALDNALKRWVAIKMLAPNLATDQVARLRFAREAQAAAAVRHEHVVTIHAVSENNGVPYLVMEYVDGGSLQDYLDRQGPADWRVVARLGAEIASGLAAAHARGLVHRDIKPSNILLQPAEDRGSRIEDRGSKTSTDIGTPQAGETRPSSSILDPGHPEGRSILDLAFCSAKIGDFGLARVADESRLTQTGLVAGTPMYMAPEQALGEATDHRADLFSLGSVLYALCTGCDPFDGGSPMAVLRQVCETTPPAIREINPAIPPWLAAVIEHLHAKRRAERFASAAEVAELLRYNLEHPDRPQLPPLYPAKRPARFRSRLLAVAGAVVVVVAALGLSEALHWTYLTGLLADQRAQSSPVRERATLRGHEGPIWSVAFAPDGQTIATGSDDTSLRFWDAATGQETAKLPGPDRSGMDSSVFAVAFAHSGKFLLSGSGDGTLRQWDVATRKELGRLPPHTGNIRRIAIAPDDRTVALANNTQSVELWDLERHELRLTLPGHQVTIQAIAFAPDGKTLATGDARGNIRLWDPVTGEERAHFTGDPNRVSALAFSPRPFGVEQVLASTGSQDRDAKLWDAATQQQLAALSGHEVGFGSLAFSADGTLLATGSRDGTAVIWNVRSAQALATLHAHQGAVWSLAFSPDGRTLVTVGDDRLGKLWDLTDLPVPQP
jgi:serine/threonine protein kinase